MLQFMGSRRVRHELATEQKNSVYSLKVKAPVVPGKTAFPTQVTENARIL